MEIARSNLELWHGQGQILNTSVRHFSSLSRAAGRQLGYLEDNQVRILFDALGEEVAKQCQV